MTIIVYNIMLYICHEVLVRGEQRVRERISETNRLLRVMTRLERGGHGVIRTVKVCPTRLSVINEGLFLDTIPGRRKGSWSL